MKKNDRKIIIRFILYYQTNWVSREDWPRQIQERLEQNRAKGVVGGAFNKSCKLKKRN
jgi:hypothetical protein